MIRAMSVLISLAAILAAVLAWIPSSQEEAVREVGPTPPIYLPTPPEVSQPLEEVLQQRPVLVAYKPAPEVPVLEVVTLRMKVTGYSPYDAIDSEYHRKYPDTKTADMTDWREVPYGVACDQLFLPFGARVRIPGYMDKTYPDAFWTVDDTGGKLRQSWRLKAVPHLDVRFRTEWSALQWGTKWVEVEVDLSSVPKAVRERLKRLSNPESM